MIGALIDGVQMAHADDHQRWCCPQRKAGRAYDVGLGSWTASLRTYRGARSSLASAGTV